VGNGGKSKAEQRKLVSDFVEDRASAFESLTRDRIEQDLLEVNQRLTRQGKQFRARLIMLVALATFMLVATGAAAIWQINKVNQRLTKLDGLVNAAESLKRDIEGKQQEAARLAQSVQATLNGAEALRKEIATSVAAVNALKADADAKTKELETWLNQAKDAAVQSKNDAQGSKESAAKLVAELAEIKTWSNAAKDNVTNLEKYLKDTAGDLRDLAAALGSNNHSEARGLAEKIAHRALPAGASK